MMQAWPQTLKYLKTNVRLTPNQKYILTHCLGSYAVQAGYLLSIPDAHFLLIGELTLLSNQDLKKEEKKRKKKKTMFIKESLEQPEPKQKKEPTHYTPNSKGSASQIN